MKRRRGVELSINIVRSEFEKALIVDWKTADGTIGGQLDLSNLFLVISDYFKQAEQKDTETGKEEG